MSGPVVLWLHQAFRTADNDVLAIAAQHARREDAPLVVLHGLDAGHPLGSPRVNQFLMACSLETMRALEKRGATTREIRANASKPLWRQVAAYAKEAKALAVYVDDAACYMSRANIEHAKPALDEADVPLHAVEPNLIVPSRSYGKAAVGAYAIRKHVTREAEPRLRARASAVPRRFPGGDAPEPPGERLDQCSPGMYARGAAFPRAYPLDLAGGEKEAGRRLRAFVRGPLAKYGERGDAVDGGAHSRLSPWLHFGCLSPRAVAQAVFGADVPTKRRDAFLEQLIVRRELAYNAARFLPTLRSLTVLPEWAQKTLAKHDGDRREHVYTERELEDARTHDEIWNATQRELRETGVIHSYMRMYWGKKIIEWTNTHAHARLVMERLNGAWGLDGRDANMWVGHLWCFGLHDRPFAERPVFGKVRWMSHDGTARKFDTDAYVAWTQQGCPSSR